MSDNHPGPTDNSDARQIKPAPSVLLAQGDPAAMGIVIEPATMERTKECEWGYFP